MKRKKTMWILLAAGLILALLLLAFFALLFPKEQSLSDAHFDLSALEDGQYQGICDNGMV